MRRLALFCICVAVAAVSTVTVIGQAQPGLEARLKVLEDRDAIRALLVRYASTLDERDFADIRPLLDEARTRGAWLVLAGHDIGAGGRQTTRITMLEELLAYAKDPANGIWLAPGSYFEPDETDSPWIRFNVATGDAPQLWQFFDSLAQAPRAAA